MYKPSLKEFSALVGQGTIAPVYRELPADLETPVSVYPDGDTVLLRYANHPDGVILRVGWK